MVGMAGYSLPPKISLEMLLIVEVQDFFFLVSSQWKFGF